MARKSVDVDQELDENTGDGEFEASVADLMAVTAVRLLV